MFPLVYFFYPETAYRSLEEMDTIFRKTDSIISVVRVARNEPHRYGKNGEQLVNYEDTDDHRRASHVSSGKRVNNKDHSNSDYFLEGGEKADQSDSS